MHILYLHPNAWTGEYAVLNELTRQGHRLSVLEEKRKLGAARLLLTYFRSKDDGIETLWYDPGRGIEKLLTWPLDRCVKKGFDGRNLVHRMWMIRAAVNHFRPQAVISSEGFSYGIPAAFLKRIGLLRPPLLTSFIGGDILDCPEAEVGKRRDGSTGWLIRAALATPELLRPVSPLVGESLRAEGADPARMHVIPSHLVLDSQTVISLHARRDGLRDVIRRQYAIPAGAPVLVTLGGNQKGKGIQFLLEAWPRILQAMPGARWLLCGPRDPWYRREIEPRIAEFPSIISTGTLSGDAVFEHLAAADLHVNPSLCESLNMVTVEAAAVGTPSITSDGAGIAHWVRQYNAGCVVPRGDVSELADAIIAALQSSETRLRWSESCVDLAKEFSVERVARMLVECFVSLPHLPAKK